MSQQAPVLLAWQRLEEDFLQYRHDRARESALRTLEHARREVEALSPRSKGQKRMLAEARLAHWERVVAEWTDMPTAKQLDAYRKEYIATVSEAISKGKEVPREVIDQRPEFQTARTARERYEKGRHTSFANVSIAVSEQLRETHGVKVKRQDGKEIEQAQVEEIAQIIQDVEDAIGPIRDLLYAVDPTIAHTNGKHPFLSTAGGLYIPSERTISVGIRDILGRPIRAGAHELGHLLDAEAGAALGVTARVWSKSRGAGGREVTYLSEHEIRRREEDEYSLLIAKAKLRFRDGRQAHRLLKMKAKDLATPEEQAEVGALQVHLGHYWEQPREIFARLFEQFVATQLGRESVAADAPEAYQRWSGWWSPRDFAELEPLVDAAIQHRLNLIRQHRVDPNRLPSTLGNAFEKPAVQTTVKPERAQRKSAKITSEMPKLPSEEGRDLPPPDGESQLALF